MLWQTQKVTAYFVLPVLVMDEQSGCCLAVYLEIALCEGVRGCLVRLIRAGSNASAANARLLRGKDCLESQHVMHLMRRLLLRLTFACSFVAAP